MMLCERELLVSNHHMQQVPVHMHSDVLALHFCTSERCASTEFLTVHSLDKLLSCIRIMMGPPGPRVTAYVFADNHASDIATNMSHGSSSTPKPLLYIYVLVAEHIGTYGTLQNSSISTHPATMVVRLWPNLVQ